MLHYQVSDVSTLRGHVRCGYSQLSASSNAVYYDTYGDTTSWYHFFTDYSTTVNAALPSSNVISDRIVRTNATCIEYTVLNQTYTDTSGVIFLSGPEGTLNVTISGATSDGDTTYVSDTDPASIGDREAKITAVVSDTTSPRGFVCYNSVSVIGTVDYYLNFYVNVSSAPTLPKQLQLPDEQARIIAGAIGWPTDPLYGNTGSVTYPNTYVAAHQSLLPHTNMPITAPTWASIPTKPHPTSPSTPSPNSASPPSPPWTPTARNKT